MRGGYDYDWYKRPQYGGGSPYQPPARDHDAPEPRRPTLALTWLLIGIAIGIAIGAAIIR